MIAATANTNMDLKKHIEQLVFFKVFDTPQRIKEFSTIHI